MKKYRPKSGENFRAYKVFSGQKLAHPGNPFRCTHVVNGIVYHDNHVVTKGLSIDEWDFERETKTVKTRK